MCSCSEPEQRQDKALRMSKASCAKPSVLPLTYSFLVFDNYGMPTPCQLRFWSPVTQWKAEW